MNTLDASDGFDDLFGASLAMHVDPQDDGNASAVVLLRFSTVAAFVLLLVFSSASTAFLRRLRRIVGRRRRHPVVALLLLLLLLLLRRKPIRTHNGSREQSIGVEIEGEDEARSYLSHGGRSFDFPSFRCGGSREGNQNGTQSRGRPWQCIHINHKTYLQVHHGITEAFSLNSQ